MQINDIIREKREGEDNLVDLLHTYIMSTQDLDVATRFVSSDDIKMVMDSNSDLQKFAINRYFRNILVTAAGGRMVKTENGPRSKLDIRPCLLNIQNEVDNLNWYNLIVNGVIKFMLDNNIEFPDKKDKDK